MNMPDDNSLRPSQVATHELMRLMIDQNAVRDRQINEILEQLIATRNEQPPQFSVMPDLNSTIGSFDGELADCDIAERWLTSLQTTAQLNRWSDTYLLECARSHLTGAAKDWYLGRQSDIETWAKFKDSFEKMFMTTMGIAEQWKKLQARVQQRNETIFAYFHAKMRMCRNLRLDEAESKKLLCIGLHSRDLCSMLMSKVHKNECELLSDIREFTEVSNERAERFGKSSSTHVKAKDKSNGQTWQPSSNTNNSEQKPKPSEPATVKRNFTEVRCYNCQFGGHIARDCPKPKKPLYCSKCSKEGHTAKYCSVKSFEVTFVEGNNYNTNNNINYGNIARDHISQPPLLHEKQVSVNGAPAVSCLVDSGSSVCLMKVSTARKLSIPWEEYSSVIRGFGVEAVTKVLGKASVNLSIDNAVLSQVPVLIVPDISYPREFIVGRPFCESPHIAFIKYRNNLEFYNTNNFPFAECEIPVSESGEVLEVAEEVIVPAGCATLVNAQLGSSSLTVAVRNDGTKEQKLQNSDILTHRLVPTCNAVQNYQPFSRPIQLDDIQVPEALDKDQREELLQLINNYRMCFALDISELGCTTKGNMNIQVRPNSQPCSSKPHRASWGERLEMKRIVKEWRDNGIVEDTQSDYMSPVLLVRKKTGEQRMVIDYRKLNAQTIRQPYPLPSIEDLLEKFVNCKLFTILDLAHGYLQVPLTENAKKYTAFITPDETGQFTRMTFGLSNAPFEFSRIMDRVMGNMKNNVVINYFDDYFIPATDWDQMRQRLEEVLKAFKEAGLTLKPKKCVFAAPTIEFLGYELSADGLKPGSLKMVAVREYPVPTNAHECRRFMGLVSFFRRFVSNFASIARPITELTKKNTVFQWGQNQQTAFELLKQKLLSKPILKLFDPRQYTELHTDASSVGIAGMLLQRGTDNLMHLVLCVSKKNNEAEMKYHSSRLELMAIVWALNRLRSMLLGLHVVVYTDCQALAHMSGMKTKNPQITRWLNLLQEFDLEIKHRAGEKMSHIDALSRAPVEESNGETMDQIIDEKLEVLVSMSEEDYIIAMQYSDEELKTIIADLNVEEPSPTIKSKYELINGILYRKVIQNEVERKLWMVPKSMRKSLVIKFHDLSGHFSVDRTVAKILEKYYFPRMRRYVRHHIHMCAACIVNKAPRGKRPGKMHPIEPGRRPFETIHIDHLGPFPTSSKNNSYLLVITDNLTKFVKLFPASSVHTKGVVKQLKTFALQFGLPRRIVCDRGTAFTSEQFRKYCLDEGIELHLCSVRHPQTNGQCERANSTILTVITTSTDKETNWDQKLAEMEFKLNNMFNKTTGKSPFQALYGYSPILHDGLFDRLIGVEPLIEDPETAQNNIRETISEAQQKWKSRYDKQKVETKLAVGEVVFLRCPPTHTGTSTKIQPKYRGPLVVTKVCDGDTYKVAAVRPSHRRLYATTAHVSLLKPFNSQTEVTDCTEDEDCEDEEPVISNISKTELTQEVNRPKRSTRLPKKLGDYVM